MGHDHPHAGPGEEPYSDPGPRSGPADALVLDIGGDIGAQPAGH
jgi:hypothetical protein